MEVSELAYCTERDKQRMKHGNENIEDHVMARKIHREDMIQKFVRKWARH